MPPVGNIAQIGQENASAKTLPKIGASRLYSRSRSLSG